MSLRRFAITALCGCLLAFDAAANLKVRPDAPQTYTVRQGDTLWDISGQFLDEPWRWQEIWQGNPEVKNPNLIYPGDLLRLSFEAGKPVVRVARKGRPVVKLSPKVRSLPARAGSIPTVPIDAIGPFLSRPLVVGETELQTAPYIVSLGAEHIVGGSGMQVFARGIKPGVSNLYTVVRRGDPYIDPDDPDGEVLGYQALHIADAALDADGDPATLTLASARREVLEGDRLVPAAGDGGLSQFLPRAPEASIEGKIINVVEGVSQIGQFQVVVLNVGEGDGLEQGSVLAVYQRGQAIHDRYALNPRARLPEPDPEFEMDPDRQRGLDGLTMAVDRFIRDVIRLGEPEDESFRAVTLPEQRAGTLMVFRTFDRLSYAIVMDARRAMHLSDVVRNP